MPRLEVEKKCEALITDAWSTLPVIPPNVAEPVSGDGFVSAHVQHGGGTKIESGQNGTIMYVGRFVVGIHVPLNDGNGLALQYADEIEVLVEEKEINLADGRILVRESEEEFAGEDGPWWLYQLAFLLERDKR